MDSGKNKTKNKTKKGKRKAHHFQAQRIITNSSFGGISFPQEVEIKEKNKERQKKRKLEKLKEKSDLKQSDDLDNKTQKCLKKIVPLQRDEMIKLCLDCVAPEKRSKLENDLRSEKQIRVYADGIFDLFHYGHALALKQAKDIFPNSYLIVGVCSDSDTHSIKGKTVMNEVERAESVRHCKWVDEVVENCPWVIDEAFLQKHRIDYVAHDAEPYDMGSNSASSGDVYSFVKELGMFAPTQRTGGISTSDLINRIVKDYDDFVRRNLKRGMNRKDMNVSYIKEKQVIAAGKFNQLKQNMKNMGDKINNFRNKAGSKLKEIANDMDDELLKWRMNSSFIIEDFLRLFEKKKNIRYSDENL